MTDSSPVDRARIGALGWLASHIDVFAPLDAPRRFESRNKPLVELLLLVMFVLRNRDVAPLPDGFARVTARLATVSRMAVVRERPVRQGNDLLLRAGLCAVLSAIGERDRALDSIVQRAVDAGLLDQAERLPYQVMEETTFLDWGGFEHRAPAVADLIARSMLSRPIDALYLTERTTYELTHNVMFGLALGERPAATVDCIDAARLHRVLIDSLDRFEREGHWDLVGELLLSWDCLGLAHDANYRGSWRRLLGQQAEDGSVPGVSTAVHDVGRPNDAHFSDSDERFQDRYHTTLVLVLAAAARMRCERRRSSRPFPPASTRRTDGGRPDEVNLVPGERDSAWLVGLLDRDDTDRSVTVCTSVLVGLVLAAAVDPAVRPVMERAAPRVRDRLAHHTALSAAPAALSLASFAILRRLGLDAPALTSFVETIRTVIGECPPESKLDWSWCESQVILAELGLIKQPVLPTKEQLWRELASATNTGGYDNLATIAQLAAACTGFGTAPPTTITTTDRTGLARLEAAGVGALRKSNLRIGCALMRSANAMAPLDPDRRRSLIEYLAIHQSTTGGYIGSEEQTVDPAAAIASGIDMELDVRLPVSLSVLWTLAEFGGCFRLYSDSIADDTGRAPIPGPQEPVQ